jgi:putative transposase
MRKPPDPHYRHRFPAELIGHAVWLYHVFSLSSRDVELLLAERGVIVSYESIRRWCLKFGASFASSLDLLRKRMARPICKRFRRCDLSSLRQRIRPIG